MKKILIAAVGMAVVFAVTAPAANASFFDGSGKFVAGYSSVYPQASSASAPTVNKDVEHPQQIVSPITGNTRVMDMAQALLISDVSAFLKMVTRAGLRF